jgi:hypothetical protein
MGSIEDADMPVLIAEMPERATPEDTEVVFDAMPIAELASTWGALQRPGRRDQMIAVWPAILYFNRLPHRQPERALDLVLEVLRAGMDQRNDQLMLSLLHAYGAVAIGRIEADAKPETSVNKRFQNLLGGVWYARAPDELKVRLDALMENAGEKLLKPC